MVEPHASSQTASCPQCGGRVPGEAAFCSHCGSALTVRSDDPLVGKVIAERYLLKQRLGEGSSGMIYLAQHLTLKRRLVVKILHESLTRDDLAVERFRREATMVGEIKDEHIVEVLDFGRTEDGRLFLTMEHLEGETLSARIERAGALPVERAIEVIRQIGEALIEAHALGYVHRDLRPRNVFLVDRRGHDFVKLLDFGLAKLVERDGEADATSLGMTFGDPRYMSPEQSRGAPIDRRSDIYSLGIIAYEALTGGPPFTGHQNELMRHHLNTVPPPPSSVMPDIPPWLDALVGCALEKSPDKRFLTVHRMLEEIAAGVQTGHVDVVRASSQPGMLAPTDLPRLPSRTGSEAERDTGLVRSADPIDSSVSQKFFADGELLAEQGESSQRTSAVRSVYEDWPSEAYGEPHRRRWVGVLIGTGVVAAVVAGWLMSRRGAAPPPADASAMGAPQVAPAVIRTWDAAPVAPAAEASGSRLQAPGPEPKADAAAPAKAAVMAPKVEPVAEPVPEPPVREPVPEPEPEPVVEAPEPPPAPVEEESDGDPESPRAQSQFYVKMGQSALAQGDVDAARQHFTKARELDLSNANALAGFGQIAMVRQQYEEALVHLEAASRLAPGSERVWLLIGEAHLGMGKPARARKAFRRALDLNPRSDAARRGLSRSAE